MLGKKKLEIIITMMVHPLTLHMRCIDLSQSNFTKLFRCCRFIAGVAGQNSIKLVTVHLHCVPDVVQDPAPAVVSVDMVHHRGHLGLLIHLAVQYDLAHITWSNQLQCFYLLPPSRIHPNYSQCSRQLHREFHCAHSIGPWWKIFFQFQY